MRRMLALMLVVILMFAMATVVFADTNKTGETKAPSPTGSTATDPEKPSDPVSPPTGSSVSTGNMMLLLAPIMLLGLFGVVVATKKLIKTH